MSTKLTYSITTFLSLFLVQPVYADVSETDLAAIQSQTASVIEQIKNNPPQIDAALQSIQPVEVEATAALESQAREEIKSEVAKNID
jgi:hypothetical protein